MYAAPVSRSMIRFNDLAFYALPELPPSWKAPEWLVLELGIFAGRLYFEWSEYEGICRALGVDHTAFIWEENEELEAPDQENTLDPDSVSNHGLKGTSLEMDGTAESMVANDADAKCQNEAPAKHFEAPRPKSFTSKPLSFMAEWLSMRRKGADFAHSPMGLISQGKPLHAGHSFFRKSGDSAENRQQAPILGGIGANPEQDDDDDDLGGDQFEQVDEVVDEADLEEHAGEESAGSSENSDGPSSSDAETSATS
jgi:hypothetical protein